MPPKGGATSLRSYDLHVGRNRCNPLDKDVLQKAADMIAAKRGTFEWDFPTGSEIQFEVLKQRVVSAARTVGLSKSPGFPLGIAHHDNKSVFESEYDDVILMSTSRLLVWLDPVCQEDIMKMDSKQLFCSSIMDPSSIFTKYEPTPSRKHKTGKYRCISPVSLVDNLVETVLFQQPANLLKESKFENGSAIGIGFSDDQIDEFYESVMSKLSLHGTLLEDDVSGFDALHTPQVYEASCCVDDRVFGVNKPEWCGANRVYSHVSSNSVSAVDGSLFIKRIIGMLNSGSKDTTRRNTLFKNLYSVYLALMSKQVPKHWNAAGDDGQLFGITDLSTYTAAAEAAGITLRDTRVIDKAPFNFCSHEYSKSGCKLTSWPKSIYRILCENVTYDDAMSFARECRQDPDVYCRIIEFINALDLPDGYNLPVSTN